MARHSQRTGPNADQEIPLAFTTINNTPITRYFDAGALYVSYRVDFDHTVAGIVNKSTRILVDGINRPALSATTQTSGIIKTTHAAAGLITILEGFHTIELQMASSAAAGDFVRANGATLTVLQLPVWDDFTDIEQ